MAQTAEQTTNGQQGVGTVTHVGQVGGRTTTPPKTLIVRPATHDLIRRVAERLDRTTDAVVHAGVRLLDEKTAGERVLPDDEWVKSIGGGS